MEVPIDKRKAKQIISKKEDEIKDMDSKIAELEQENTKFQKECKSKATQLKGSESNLMDLQRFIADVNQEIVKFQNQKESSAKENAQMDKRGDDKEFKEIGKKLQEKLEEIAKNRQTLLPTKVRDIKEIRDNTDDLIMVHTVKILYIKSIKDGDIRKLDRSKAAELALRINKDTKFHDLKILACHH